MKYCTNKDVDALLIRVVREFECTVHKKRAHLTVSRAGYTTRVTTATTPSDRRAWLNVRAQLRRYLDVPFD